MRDEKGLTSLELILIIFLFGLVIKYMFPFLSTNIMLNRDNVYLDIENHIYYNIIEAMKVSNKNKDKSIELYSIDFLELLGNFESSNYYIDTFELDEDGRKYSLDIEKENKSDKFWKIKIQLTSILEDRDEDEKKSVEFLLPRR